MKRVIVKDWHILPLWQRGLALGAIIGSGLLILSSFLIFINEKLFYVPVILFFLSCIFGVLISKHKKLQKKLKKF